MPNYDRTEGIVIKKGEACASCSNYPDNCNVMSDFRLEGKEAKWEGMTIVKVGEGKDREGYLECQMYRRWIPREELKDHPDVASRDFGTLDSSVAADYYFSVADKK